MKLTPSQLLSPSNVTRSSSNPASGNSLNTSGEVTQPKESGSRCSVQANKQLNKKFSNHLVATPAEVLAHLSSFAVYTRDQGGFIRTAKTKGPQHNQVIGQLVGCTANGYRRLALLGHLWTVSRLVWAVEYGEWPQGEIDHIDGDTLNDHINNLRVVDSIGNGQNKKLYSNNKTGYVGVKLNRYGRYMAQATVNKKRHHIGIYSTAEQAAEARDAFLAQFNTGFTDRHGKL